MGGLLGALILMMSCESDKSADELTSPTNKSGTVEREEDVIPLRLEDLVGDHLDTTYETFELEEGNIVESVVIGGDGFMPQPQFESIVDKVRNSNPGAKQFRTSNLVSAPFGRVRTITIRGVNSGNRRLSGRELTGLRQAVDLYNRLNLRIRFQLSFGPDNGNSDIFVRRRFIGGFGGIAQFPRNGGRPGSYIFLNSQTGAGNITDNAIRHLMAHEIGHTIGMRHNDWNTRLSCFRDNQGRESTASGVIYVNGPGAGIDRNSIYNACLSIANTNGQFNQNDINFLRALYGR